MTVDFNDYFWGEKNNGFEVLYLNMKLGVQASKELSEFFREKSNIEEQNSKMISKLAHKASTATLNGTFAPVWTILRTSAEKLSTLHQQMMQKLTELVKDVAKYADELHKKHKTVKEEETQTLHCMQAIQVSTAAVLKSRDLYSNKAQELEKLRKENASHKDIEKAETKLKKLQEEHKALLDKHYPLKEEFERRMTQACKHFQEIEEVHLRQMKEFLSTYLELLQTNHDMVGQVHSDFKRQFLDMTVDKLLEQFVLNKYTGLERPEIPELDFIPFPQQCRDFSSHSEVLQPISTIPSAASSNSATSLQGAATRTAAGGNISMDQRGGGSEVCSLGGASGSGSLLNADDTILGIATSSARPSSPELMNAINASTPPPATNANTTTTRTTTASTSTVKHNIRNWFSSSIPGKQQQTNANVHPNVTAAASTSSGNIVSGILRSRRDKTKTKKSKKKKDVDAANNIQEERLASIDRANNTLDHDHEHGKMKNQNSSGSSASGLAAISSASAPGSVDSTAVTAGTQQISAAQSLTTTAILAGNINITTTAGTGGSGHKSNEVDEDGYSVQPPKEIAWEENHDNVGSFYSDSDSDSDHDKRDRRIHVNIRPAGQAPMSASVDELRATVENISLSPTGVFSHSQQLQQSRIASRQQSPEISNASTPTATVHPYAPLQSPTLSMSNNSRYTDLGDIFSELGDMSASAPASATISKPSSRQIPTPTSASSIAIPRPPSRRSEMVVSAAVARGRISPSTINRADSIGSLEFRTAIGGISRGPSPLTIGISDMIPLAVAFHEIIHAYFRGSDESRCQVKVSGDMMLSFPAGIVGLLANNPNPAKLSFRIKNVNNLENLIPNGKLVQIDKSQSNSFSAVLEFNMSALTALLRRQAEHNPTASYFNVDILKYQARTKPGASSCPFQLVSYWKCETTYTALKIDYKYNNHAMAKSSPLLNVTLSVPVNGSVRNVQSKPHSAWLGESNRLVWNFTEISQNAQDGGIGTLRARLELNDGPSTPAILTTQFNCEGTTLSGIEFELQGSGYRLSLVKRRFVSGKYVCEGDGIRSGATPTPPSVGSSSPFSAKSN